MTRRHTHWLIAVTLSIALITVLALAPVWIIHRGTKHVYADMLSVNRHPVAIVFGAGILRDGTPTTILRDRLAIAAELYRQRKVQVILVSGDNSTEEHNEPEAMFNYLTEREGVPKEHVFQDFAGRRTYDTCIRAREIWGIEHALLISQGYHLPRAIFTCKQLGVEAWGMSSTEREYRGILSFKAREILAMYNALFDLFVFTPSYIGGDSISDLQHALQSTLQ